MLKSLLDLKQTQYKSSWGDVSRIIKQDNLLRLDNIKHTQAVVTINENPYSASKQFQNQMKENIFFKKYGTLILISNPPKNYKAKYAST